VEFNARFGDPETQVVLARLATPLGGLLHAAATGRLAEHPPLRWSDGAAVTVVMAAQGSPEHPRGGEEIDGLDLVHEPAYVLHAGTRRDADGALVSAGGRVLSVTATGADLAAARRTAYDAVAHVNLAGSHYRLDVGLRAERGEIVVPAAPTA
jgi:phosphoribosylamine--glycine ligase